MYVGCVPDIKTVHAPSKPLTLSSFKKGENRMPFSAVPVEQPQGMC